MFLLGIDVGSTRTKATVLSIASGEVVESVSVAGPFVERDGGTEATFEEVVASVRVALGLLRRGSGGEDLLGGIAGIGIAGVAESGVPFDAAQRPLAPAIAWHDRRGESLAERLSAAFGADLDRAIGQRLRYVSTVAKFGCLIEQGGVDATAVHRWLGVPEAVLFALTGSEATEWSLAARTGCFDVRTREWLPDVADAGGFGVEVFPDVLAAGEVMGRVSTEASDWSGLPSGVPVTVAGHDHLAGFLGSGAGSGDLANSVGTAETVLGRSPGLPDMVEALAAGVAVTVFPGGDGWAALASAARSGQAVEAAAAVLGASPAELDRLAVYFGPDELLPAPGLVESLRRRDPPALPIGPPGRVWATLLDALAQEAKAAAQRVSGLLGERQRLVVFGGGSRSDPWLGAKARLVGMPVVRALVADAVARGAALAGGTAAGMSPGTGD